MKKGKGKAEMAGALVAATIEQRIFLIRGQAVMMDAHLAGLYEVLTKNLVKAVKRNIERFPADFMFQLTGEEAESLRFQIGTLESGRGKHRKYLPYVFTEHGVAMLSSVLRSDRAIKVNIEIMRAFVAMKKELIAHSRLAHRMDKVEKQVGVLADIVRGLIEPPAKPKRKIGFRKGG